MVYSLSEDAKDGKGTKQNTLRFQSLGLGARLDGLFHQSLGIGKVDKANNEEEDGDGDRLAVHAPIITCSPVYARGTSRKRSENIAS